MQFLYPFSSSLIFFSLPVAHVAGATGDGKTFSLSCPWLKYSKQQLKKLITLAQIIQIPVRYSRCFEAKTAVGELMQIGKLVKHTGSNKQASDYKIRPSRK